ncbi:dTDP-4-dehydrorhamnose reductase [Rheinheimera soli]|uniref:dTDP-4-dehydrorhamnose reductase n=1 Tax=Rheinheimera soli TaxID=443616 RepID=A0ABU1VUD0_9GAMM|nr:dTDP-4-dehydrorhamnose reductase [Rheinheimera soli]MDR7119317.1 dTDP-4-dehydrorhamnose reductase [Rheinheimera soli]
MAVIVLLAPTGQVGFELARSLAPLGQLHYISRADVDFSDTAAVQQKVAALQPDVIVNAAAWTAVDKAETEAEGAYLLNAALPQALAQVAQQQNAWLVHYSSDYVYPGNGTAAWQECDQTAPLSVYGASKLAGDIAIQNACAKHLIFRTSWVYAARGNNFMRTMLKLALSREALKVVADQVGAPTPARLIAQVSCLALQQALIKGAQVSGIYHLAPKGETSWYGFAEAIFAFVRKKGIALQLQPAKFEAINTDQYPMLAKRPANSRLNLTKIEHTFGMQMPDWHGQLELTLEELLSSQTLLTD